MNKKYINPLFKYLAQHPPKFDWLFQLFQLPGNLNLIQFSRYCVRINSSLEDPTSYELWNSKLQVTNIHIFCCILSK